jgi:N utilization substance protein A
MNPNEVLRIVDAIHRDKNIDKEIVFQAIESALVSATRKNFSEEADIVIQINRQDGSITGHCNGEPLDPEETVGRIGAQTAKQVIIQKIREAERDALYDEYEAMLGQMVGGIVQRNEGGATTVSLGNVEAILPRSEQIPGETHGVNERVRATVFDVRKQGTRVKVILSRIRPQLVQRLFEQEIPEIADGVIEVRALAREPGYRTKVAVSSADQRVDCVGACVGVRGNRIKNIVDELAGERIDIVRWSDDMQVLIPNALQPAEVDEVILCNMIGRAIVLVREDQLSLAIGRRGQNVRLASKLCKWDIEIMTQEELQEQIERAVAGFSTLAGVADQLAERLVGEGFLSYDDLSVIEPDDLQQMSGLAAEEVEAIIEEAERRAEEAEEEAAQERRRLKQQQAAGAAGGMPGGAGSNNLTLEQPELADEAPGVEEAGTEEVGGDGLGAEESGTGDDAEDETEQLAVDQGDLAEEEEAEEADEGLSRLLEPSGDAQGTLHDEQGEDER